MTSENLEKLREDVWKAISAIQVRYGLDATAASRVFVESVLTQERSRKTSVGATGFGTAGIDTRENRFELVRDADGAKAQWIGSSASSNELLVVDVTRNRIVGALPTGASRGSDLAFVMYEPERVSYLSWCTFDGGVYSGR